MSPDGRPDLSRSPLTRGSRRGGATSTAIAAPYAVKATDADVADASHPKPAIATGISTSSPSRWIETVRPSSSGRTVATKTALVHDHIEQVYDPPRG